MLSTDEHHLQPDIYFRWLKRLLHFGLALPYRQTSYQQRARPDGCQLMVLL
jgi:hypothetical protein